MTKTILTQAELKSQLHYNPETGIFTWAIDKSNFIYAGDIAGTLNITGYRHITLNGVTYKEHRLVWLYVHGYYPDKDIDHINNIRNDNRIVNLRLATTTQNQMNKFVSKRNTTGYKGVTFDAKRNKFVAYGTLNGKRKTLGRFLTAIEASNVYKEFCIKHYGDYFKIA